MAIGQTIMAKSREELVNLAKWRTNLAWLFALVALGCGIAGAVSAVWGWEWKLQVATWFGAGALVALLAIFLRLDEYPGGTSKPGS